MDALHVLVELGVLERQSDELGDRFGGGDLLRGELAFDVVEQVDQADDLVAGHQGQRDGAALAVATHLHAFCFAEPRVVEVGYCDGAARLESEPVTGPVLEAKLLAHPGGVVDAVQGGGQADQAPLAREPVDVAVGDLQGGAQASCRRLQDLIEVERQGQLEARLEQQLVAPFGLVEPQFQSTVPGCARYDRLQVVTQEAALAARGTLAGDLAGVGPAPHRAGADAEQTGSPLHAKPLGG